MAFESLCVKKIHKMLRAFLNLPKLETRYQDPVNLLTFPKV